MFSQFEDKISWELDNPSAPLKAIMYPAVTVQGVVKVPPGRSATDVRIHTDLLASPNPMAPIVASPLNADMHAVQVSPATMKLSPTPAFQRLPDLSTDLFLSDVYDVTPKTDGTFAIADVPANGRLDLVASGPGMARQRLMPNVNDPTPPTFAMTAQAILRGRVTLPDGKPAAGIALRLSGGFEWQGIRMDDFAATTDADGRYTIDQLPGQPVYLSLVSTADYIINSHIIHLEAGATATEDLRLSPGTLVTGSVTDANRKAIPNVNVHATATPDQMAMGSAATDAQGRYTIRLPEGSFRLDLREFPPGYARPLEKGEMLGTEKGAYSIMYSELAQTISISVDAATLDGPTFVLKAASTEPSQSQYSESLFQSP